MPAGALPGHASSVCGVQVMRIHDGLWRWSVTTGGVEMASAYLEYGAVMLLVDPVLPSPGDDLDRFLRAIHRDLERLDGTVHVMLTRADDPRDSAELARITGARTWTHGHPTPEGMQEVPTGDDDEVGLWSTVHAALMPGRALPPPGSPMAALPAQTVIPSVGPMPAAP